MVMIDRAFDIKLPAMNRILSMAVWWCRRGKKRGNEIGGGMLVMAWSAIVIGFVEDMISPTGVDDGQTIE